ncbi:MAG: type VI secretion system contractile sheath small subunit [Polyangiales bacterium]
MSTNGSGQKFIRRNRAPRVQIEYDVETYGSQKKVQLPFVMGVMADLAGNQTEPPAKLEDRKFLEFDHDNFDSRLRAMRPRVATSVANKLTGQGSMGVELVFKSMDDFSPSAIANNIEPLRNLLEARKRLADLIAYMDGRGDAEALLSAGLKDPEKLRALVSSLSKNASADETSTTADDHTEKSE